MGADTFGAKAKGKTAEHAFREAVRRAEYDHGHAGYTGTIAEKDSYVMIPVPAEYKARPQDYARKLVEDSDPRIDDKWGPAGCIELGKDEWLFFGWASC